MAKKPEKPKPDEEKPKGDSDRFVYTDPGQFKVIGERPEGAKGWDDEDDEPELDDK